MFKIILFISIILSTSAFSQSTKPDPDSQINAEEQINSLPGGSAGAAYSVRTQKRTTIKAPAVIAPAENITPANCADTLGAKGSATFTACEAAKRTR